jgi:hypothetical protein
MNSRPAKILLAIGAAATLALPAAAVARQGADDPAGHVRQEVTEVHHHNAAEVHHHHANQARHGADDGPGHR